MPLLDDVRLVVQRLAPRGWAALLQQHGLNLNAVNLKTELQRNLTGIRRDLDGFKDFSSAGQRAIEPGKPSLSLLYHALASPNAIPLTQGPRTAEDFPTLIELDAVENYIYSLARPKLAAIKPSHVIAVLAYQYRAGSRSPHKRHADMAYSRTGIARVGTAPMNYDRVRRSFWMAPADGAAGIAVMPARYGVFLCESRRPAASDAIQHKRGAADNARQFLFPIHKLFAGDECIDGAVINTLAFLERHRTEKLKKVHDVDPSLILAQGFDRTQPPFVRETDLVRLDPAGAATLVTPIPRGELSRLARQFNSRSGRVEIIRFTVAPANAGNRFESSYQILPVTGGARGAPEYVHIRTRVESGGLTHTDLNNLPQAQFDQTLNQGGYEAAHYVDDSCEGVIAVSTDLLPSLRRAPAYSIVSAPDFLPLVDQLEIQLWAERRNLLGQSFFAQGAPDPLCDGRLRPNPTLPNPLPGGGDPFPANRPDSRTVVAVVATPAQSTDKTFGTEASLSTTWLPDGASNIFAPGWDTSIGRFGSEQAYANFGLGSPFPEDAKLCAALNSFWPAAAPDVGRTFGGFTALPHLDEELGFHPRHPRVLRGEVNSRRGWDGEFGPFFTSNETKVSFARLDRSDYTVNATKGLLRPDVLQRIDAVEQIARMEGYFDSVVAVHGLLGSTLSVGATRLRLVVAEKIPDWALVANRPDASLNGAGYRYVLVLPLTGAREADPQDSKRFRISVEQKVVCEFDRRLLVVRIGTNPAQSIPRPVLT